MHSISMYFPTMIRWGLRPGGCGGLLGFRCPPDARDPARHLGDGDRCRRAVQALRSDARPGEGRDLPARRARHHAGARFRPPDADGPGGPAASGDPGRRMLRSPRRNRSGRRVGLGKLFHARGTGDRHRAARSADRLKPGVTAPRRPPLRRAPAPAGADRPRRPSRWRRPPDRGRA